MPRLALRKGTAEQPAAPQAAQSSAQAGDELSERVRQLRAARGWSLEEASAAVGLSRSALSKIERGEMSPTFQAMQKLAQGFGLSLIDLLRFDPEPKPTGRRSIVRRSEGARHRMPNYLLRFLSGDLKNPGFLAVEVVFTARALSEFPDWDRHDDEDFLFILDGTVVLHTEYYDPVELEAGDAVQFDARMGHAFVSVGQADARALWITTPPVEPAQTAPQPAAPRVLSGAGSKPAAQRRAKPA